MMKRDKTDIPRSAAAIIAVFLVAFGQWGCIQAPLTGGGSDTEISGRMVAATGESAADAIVALIDTGYDPAFDGPLPENQYDTTDLQGNYHFDSVDAGSYNLWARNQPGDEQVLVGNVVAVDKKETRVHDEALKAPAFIRVLLPDSLAGVQGRLSVPGTMLSIETTGSGSVVDLPAVPQGVLASIRFRVEKSDAPTVLFTGVKIVSADTITLNPYNEVSGRIFESVQTVSGAMVTLIPSGYNPAFEGALPGKLRAATGVDGVYHMYNIDQGSYTLFAARGAKIIYPGVTIDSRKSIAFTDVTIKGTATIIVPLPDSLQSAAGFVYMPGTLSSVRSAAGATSVRFDSLAQGTYPNIVYQSDASDPAIVLFTNVVIDSAGLFVLDPYTAWQREARVTLNTTAAGANVTETVFGFPVLVRLTSAELDFSQARREGEDLRFVRTDNSPVPFEIEYWDSATATAAVWVSVDTVRGNSSAQSLRMLWGNPAAKKTSSPARVFDTAHGFQGVWHFGEAGGDNKRDATANNFVGTPVEMDGSSDVPGVAGRGLDFDGSSRCVSVLNARNTRLDVQADSFYTVSAWVYSRNTQRDNRVIVSKGSAQFGLMVNDQNQWEFYGGLRGYGVDTTTTSAATVNVWTHLTGVRKGMRQYLYVNGVLADSTAAAAGVSASISNNYYDLVIGRQSDDQSQWFDGLVDEVRVENRVRSPGWIRLCSENQKSGQRFVQIQKVR
ncbi:MAG: DUF2341 domain-containing protein [Chitinispirillaceae bacterium]|nr:DUF2341 domain-containing protein [Chitinispirillaceae bacterium]